MKKTLSILSGIILTFIFITPVSAIWHVGGNPPYTLNLVNNTSTDWTPYIQQAAADWSQSTVIDIVITGSGKMKIVNGTYGSNYPASWTTLTYSGGYTKTANISLNDTWLAGFTPAQKQHAVCAEIGNAISSDEGCRDRVTGEWFTSPTQQDFDELVAIYGN